MKRPSGASDSHLSRPKTTPVLFRCLLEEHATDLLPKAALAELRKLKAADDLVLNPYCFLNTAEIRTLPYLSSFAAPEEIVWILDPDANALWPFWVDDDVRTWLAGLQPGEAVNGQIPDKAAKVLRFARILVRRKDLERRRSELAQEIAKASAYFQKNRYVPLKDLLHPLHIAALRRYVRDLMAAGKLAKGKGGYKHCHLEHNEPAARFFHHQMTSVVSEIVGEPVQPSFTFTISYHGGAELSTHTDREQCEFTISLCVDFIPEPETVTSWPLCLETKGGRVVIEQGLGDGILFCGREVPHYRDRLADGCTSTSILFHFVRRNFDLELD